MRVCQSLGLRGGLPTPFYYSRDSKGLHVRRIRGDSPEIWIISHIDWQALLEVIADVKKNKYQTFSVAQTDHSEAHPQSLYKLVRAALDRVPKLDDSLVAYVCAILVHEGTLQLHHGKTVGPDARLILRRSVPDASPNEFE